MMKAVARQFYRTTHGKEFSVNDFREFRLHDFMKKRNSIGAFFGALNKEGYVVKIGHIKSTHKEGKSRWVWAYRWSSKAHSIFQEAHQ